MDFWTILQNRDLLVESYSDCRKYILLCSPDLYALFHMKKKMIVLRKKEKKDFDFVKYNKKVFSGQNMYQIEKNSREFVKNSI